MVAAAGAAMVATVQPASAVDWGSPRDAYTALYEFAEGEFPVTLNNLGPAGHRLGMYADAAGNQNESISLGNAYSAYRTQEWVLEKTRYLINTEYGPVRQFAIHSNVNPSLCLEPERPTEANVNDRILLEPCSRSRSQAWFFDYTRDGGGGFRIEFGNGTHLAISVLNPESAAWSLIRLHPSSVYGTNKVWRPAIT